jgi:hypothetical protein
MSASCQPARIRAMYRAWSVVSSNAMRASLHRAREGTPNGT